MLIERLFCAGLTFVYPFPHQGLCRTGEGDGAGEGQLSCTEAHHDFQPPRLYHKVHGFIIIPQLGAGKGKGHPFFLSCLQGYPQKSGQLLHRADDVGVTEVGVKLDHLVTVPAAGVFQLARETDHAIGGHLLAFQLQVGQGKVGVAETVAEGEEGRGVLVHIAPEKIRLAVVSPLVA